MSAHLTKFRRKANSECFWGDVLRLADVMVILGSVDIVMGEVDR
jgi:NADH:ubiquinone oxidoreductase subunit D